MTFLIGMRRKHTPAGLLTQGNTPGSTSDEGWVSSSTTLLFSLWKNLWTSGGFLISGKSYSYSLKENKNQKTFSRPICLPDDDDLDIEDLGTGIAIGWGVSALKGYHTDTTCQYQTGLYDPDDLPTKLKKIDLK